MSAKIPIKTREAPAAIGPYSQGVRAGEFVFTSGQLPTPPQGELESDDIGQLTRQALANISAILSGAGASLADVVKVVVFLTDMNDFDAMNSAYAEAFSAPYPARSCIEVSHLPKGVPIEIEAVAWIGSGREP